MSRDLKTVPANLPLREAARELARLGIHGAPVVDSEGRCLGVVSVSDLARWVARPADPILPPRACPFQDVVREPGGSEAVLCLLRPGSCSLQRYQERAGGRLAVVCAEPHGICTDWQVVKVEALPTDEVRHFMSTEIVSAIQDARVADLARLMLDRGVHRVIVLDPDGRPVGIVSVTDILGVVAEAGSEEGAGA